MQGRDPAHFQFALADAGDPPDPQTHAWREDLADVALAGKVISPHYAAPVARTLSKASPLTKEADASAEVICQLGEGATFALLDSRGDWAWGYGGEDRLVGYVPVSVLA
ncbi:SH3 domain-containing protein [Sphingomicrobium clamense]|uniref:SH3 domain-containing protein n=1 Tax=Sphingomicrobium clamense TaxID=2851013 RepID=A0ABS6V5G4_9SPHN|nr:SH3 domain-containing protein [Sphingomicrobium sp. B8]MBW0144783.1 SH3 domain-containing protein [Sphingomicrobium sp. B8]